MGYCSDVKVIMAKEDWKKFKNGVIDGNLISYLGEKYDIDFSQIDKYEIDYFFETCNVTDLPNSNDLVVLAWEWIKWREYDKDSMCSVFWAWLDDLEEKNHLFNYIRIGENWEDNDTRECDGGNYNKFYDDGYGRIEISRSIEVFD